MMGSILVTFRQRVLLDPYYTLTVHPFFLTQSPPSRDIFDCERVCAHFGSRLWLELLLTNLEQATFPLVDTLNPAQAIRIAPHYGEVHPCLLTGRVWVQANHTALLGLGVTFWLLRLLRILSGEYPLAVIDGE